MHSLLEPVLLLAFFLGATALLHELSERFKFPYVVALLLLGFLAQAVVYLTGLEVEAHLSPDLIFYVLLPLLLFGASLHIHFHHFKLQFKTISFLASVGLLISVATVGLLLHLFLGMPLAVALLFGALISATDPIAVLALFKSVGAPRRLALVIDGESMFNDATGVIAFRVVLSFVLGTYALTTHSVIGTIGNFLYVFFGSLLVGALFGLVGSLVIERIRENMFVETTITVVLALLSFIIPEHYWGLSGVIACVLAGIIVGNLGKTKISGGVVSFLEEFWEYVSVLAIALVFFFASFSLNVFIFQNWWTELAIVITAVLIARAASVYLSVFFTNNLPFFKDEPNITMSWQHILNWGGLRGVIPLVLVFSLPDTFAYKEQLLLFTLGVLMFSLFINGLSIEWLLKKLGIHIAKKEEAIIAEELDLFNLEQAKNRLKKFPDVSAEKKVIAAITERLNSVERMHRQHLMKLANYIELKQSLLIQALRIEASVVKDLFLQRVINEAVYFDLEAQFDLQEDALEYPDLFTRRVISKEGMVDSSYSYRRQLRRIKSWASRFDVLATILGASKEQLIKERYMLLKARLIANYQVLSYFQQVKDLFNDTSARTDKATKALKEVTERYDTFRQHNLTELQTIARAYPGLIEEYHLRLVEEFLVW